MTLVAATELTWPALLAGPSAAATGLQVANITFDSATDRVAWVGRASFTDSIAKVYFRTFTVTTGSDIEVRIESVTNGRPSGSLLAANTNANVTVADGDDNTWKTATLTAAASLVPGQEFAIVLQIGTSSPTGAPNMILGGRSAGIAQYAQLGQYPLVLQDTGGGSYAQLANSWLCWIVELTSAGVTFVRGLSPSAATATTTAFNSGSSPDEYALKFTVPAKMRCTGAHVYLANIAAGADFTVSLWSASSDDDTDALAQIAEDGDFSYGATVDGYVTVYWDEPVTLTAGTTYYLGVRADTANNLAFACLVAKDADSMPAFNIPDDGSMFLATRTWSAGTAGAWTETATSTLPIASLNIDQIDDGAGGGSSKLVGPGGLVA